MVGGAGTTAESRSPAGAEKTPFPQTDRSSVLPQTISPLTGTPGVQKLFVESVMEIAAPLRSLSLLPSSSARERQAVAQFQVQEPQGLIGTLGGGTEEKEQHRVISVAEGSPPARAV